MIIDLTKYEKYFVRFFIFYLPYEYLLTKIKKPRLTLGNKRRLIKSVLNNLIVY